MEESINTGLVGSYLKIGIATLIGAGLALGIFFLVSQGDIQGQGANHSSSLCVCPNCGFTVPKPAGMDCEEVNCPSCGHSMNRAAVLAAAPQRGAGLAPMTQNQRETLAEQRIATPGTITQNQRETLAEQGLRVARGTSLHVHDPVANQHLFTPLDNQGDMLGQRGLLDNQGDRLGQRGRLDNLGNRLQLRGQAAAATLLPPIGKPGMCVCPSCGMKLDRQPGAYCSHTRCPNCGTSMTNAIYVGHGQKVQTQGEARLAAMHGGGGPPCQQGGSVTNTGNGPPRQQGTTTNNTSLTCPGAATGTAMNGTPAVSTSLTYSSPVRAIIARECLRCHGGPIRNLGTYNHVKAYADNGLLMMMIQPGGPMSRFLTAEEAHQIISWIKAGAPQ